MRDVFRGRFGVRGLSSAVAAGAASAVGLAVLGAPLVLPGSAAAAGLPAPDPTADVTGTVYAVAPVGDRLVVAGALTAVGGAARGNLGALLPTGEVDPSFAPRVKGTVYAVAASADGRTVYLGGAFTAVGGVSRANLAAVDATTGTLLGSWAPRTDGAVRALAVSGSRVYVGGTFSTIAGQARPRLSAVDARTGAVQTAFSPAPDKMVRALAVTRDGTRIFAAGGFGSIGGRSRPAKLAELSTGTGTATSFDPSTGAGQGLALTLGPDESRVYVGGANDRVVAFDPAVSDAPVWTATTNGDVRGLAATDTDVYAVGAFTSVRSSNVTRSRLAALGVPDGAATSWDLPVTGGTGAQATVLAGGRLVVAGDLTGVGDTARRGLFRTALGGGSPNGAAAVLDAGPDQVVRDDTSVRLSGRLDGLAADRSVGSDSWTQTGGPRVTLVDAGDAGVRFTPPPGAASLTFVDRVVDDQGRAYTDSVTVRVVATPTVAVIGDSLTARSGSTTALPTREAGTRASLVAAGYDPGSVYWWGRGGKTVAGADSAGHTTMRDLDDATAALGGPVDAVVVGLGTNNAGADPTTFTADVNRVLDAAAADRVGHVLWIDLAFYNGANTKALAKNPLLAGTLSARGGVAAGFNTWVHSPGVYDAKDWIYPADGTHMTAQGWAKRDRFIVDQLLALG